MAPQPQESLWAKIVGSHLPPSCHPSVCTLCYPQDPSKLNSHSEYAFLRSDRFDPRHPVQEIKTACQRIVRELEPITDEWQEDFDQSRQTFDFKYDQYQDTKEETFRIRLEKVPFVPGQSYLAPGDRYITGAESEIPYDPVFGPDGQLATPPPGTSQHVTEWGSTERMVEG